MKFHLIIKTLPKSQASTDVFQSLQSRSEFRNPVGFNCGSFARIAMASALAWLVGMGSGVAAQPSQLRILKVTPSGQNVIVSWQGGRDPYQLLCRTNLDGEWRKVGLPTAAFQVTNPSIPGPACFYRVTTDLTAPLTPGGLVVTTNLNDTELVLRWNPVLDNSGGAGLKGYNVFRNNVFVKRVLPTATSTVDTGLTPDTPYSYAVSAEDIVANESARSSTVSGRTPKRGDNSAPTVPTGLAASAPNCSTISLSWNASTDVGNSGLKGYNLYRGGTYLTQVLAPTTSYNDTGRAASTTYSYTVLAIDNANNASAQSAPVSRATPACPDTTAPSVPTGFAAAAVNCSTINLSWIASTDTGGSGVKGYNVYRSGVYLAQVSAPSTTFSDLGRAASTFYSYTVQAVDNANNTSAQTAASGATTPACPDTFAPSVPTGFSATAVNCSTINLSWIASTDTGGSGVKGYNVYRSGVYLAQVSAPSTTFSDLGRAASTFYSYTVQAVDNANNASAQTSASGATTPACPDTSAPSVPTGLSAIAGGTNRINLSWNGSSDTGGSGLAGYKVWRGTVYLGTTPSTSYSDVGLAPSSTYCYSVAAYDNAGNNSAQTGQSCGTTDAMTQPCSYSLSPGSANPGSLAGNGTFNVTAGAGCSWTVSSSAPSWLTFAPSSGAGSATVTWYVTANTSTSARSGTLSIAGQTFSVTQAGLVSGGTGGVLQWVKPAQGSDFFDNAGATAVAADRAGSLVSVGSFQGTVDFGNGPRTASTSTSDGYVVKHNSQGGLSWLKQIGGAGNDSVDGVAIDSQDNIIVLGGFRGTVDLGGGPLVSAGVGDLFIAKYSPSGVHMWSKRFGGPWDEVGASLTLDANDNIFLAARFQSVNAFFGNDSTGSPVLLSNGSQYYDIALAKLSSAGTTLWAKKWGGADEDVPFSIAVDRSGDLWVAGRFTATTELGGGTRTSTGSEDGFIAKYAGATGNRLWDRKLGSARAATCRGITTDPNTGNVIITGTFMGTTDFGGGAVASGTGSTMFLAGYDSAGNYLWAKTWGGELMSSGDSGCAVKVDSSGVLILTASYNSVWMPDPTIGGQGFFVAGFSISGNSQPVYRWCKRSGTLNYSSPCSIAFDAQGYAITAGYFNYTTDFGGTTFVAPGGTTGAFVAKYTK